MMGRTPTTPLLKIPRSVSSTPGGSRAREERILVTVRVRPLNRREQALYDLISWECTDYSTIIYKNPNQERPGTSYTFGTFTNHELYFLVSFHICLKVIIIYRPVFEQCKVNYTIQFSFRSGVNAWFSYLLNC